MKQKCKECNGKGAISINDLKPDELGIIKCDNCNGRGYF